MKGYNEEQGEEDGESYKESEEMTATAKYGSSNKSKQPTVALNSMIMGNYGADGDFFISSLCGALGKATDDLCTELYIDYDDDYDYDEDESLNFSYSYNNDGTIAKETVKGTCNDTFTYKYKEFVPSRYLEPLTISEKHMTDSEKFEAVSKLAKTLSIGRVRF